LAGSVAVLFHAAGLSPIANVRKLLLYYATPVPMPRWIR